MKGFDAAQRAYDNMSDPRLEEEPEDEELKEEPDDDDRQVDWADDSSMDYIETNYEKIVRLYY